MHFDQLRTQIHGQPQSCQSTQSFLSGPVWTYPFWPENSLFSVWVCLASSSFGNKSYRKKRFSNNSSWYRFQVNEKFHRAIKYTFIAMFKNKFIFSMYSIYLKCEGITSTLSLYNIWCWKFFNRLRDVFVFRRSFLSFISVPRARRFLVTWSLVGYKLSWVALGMRMFSACETGAE